MISASQIVVYFFFFFFAKTRKSVTRFEFAIFPLPLVFILIYLSPRKKKIRNEFTAWLYNLFRVASLRRIPKDQSE